MLIDLSLVKQLRDKTSLSMNDCKKAIEQSNGNMDAAIDLLKQWGELKGKEKADKITTEGQITTFASENVIGMVEVLCQTDFLSRSPEFLDLVYSFPSPTFEEKRVDLIAKSGENIVLSRKEIYDRSKTNIIRSYIHRGNKLGVLIEATSSDYTEEVINFVDDCALQVAAMSPVVLSKDDLSPETVIRQTKIFEAQLAEAKKPQQAWPKIIEGKLNKWHQDVCLLDQFSIKEQKRTVNDIKQELEKKIGFEIKINKFTRYELGVK